MYFLVKKELAESPIIVAGKIIMPYLPKEMFSAKSTQYKSVKTYKKLHVYHLTLDMYINHGRYVAVSTITDTQTHTYTHTHKMTNLMPRLFISRGKRNTYSILVLCAKILVRPIRLQNSAYVTVFILKKIAMLT